MKADLAYVQHLLRILKARKRLIEAEKENDEREADPHMDRVK